MIKILHIITTLELGGAQRDVVYTVRKLDKDKFDVLLVISSKGMLVEEAKKIKRVKLFLIPQLQRELNFFRDLIVFLKLFRIIRGEKVDIVHTHSSKAGILGRWAAKLAGVPIIIHSVHGWGFHNYQPVLVKRFYIWLERVTAGITTKLIADSQVNLDEGLSEKIGSSSQYIVVYGGIERERFTNVQVDAERKRRGLGLDPSKPVVGMVARLEPQKAPLDFIRLARDVSLKLPDTQFLLVGDGPLRPEVESYIQRLGLKEKIILTGWRWDIPEIMASLDLFVLTSLWEGLPRVFAEAIAVKRPVVATDVGGVREMITDGDNGYLFSPRTNGAMAEKIVGLLKDKNKREKMGNSGSERIWPAFDITTTVRKLTRLYESLIWDKAL